MPHRKAERPLGRPPLYSAHERPVTVSLRISADLVAQLKRYASLHRQSVTELLLDGLQRRLSEGNPRGLGVVLSSKAIEYDQAHSCCGRLVESMSTWPCKKVRSLAYKQRQREKVQV
jgi:hypothetical protein